MTKRSRDIDFTLPADLVDYRQLDAFEEVAGMFAFDHSIVDDQGQAHKIRMAQITDNFDETLGIRAQRGRLFEEADAVLWIQDASDVDHGTIEEKLPDDIPITIVRNKIDLTNDPAGTVDGGAINLSAKTGEVIDLPMTDEQKRAALSVFAEA